MMRRILSFGLSFLMIAVIVGLFGPGFAHAQKTDESIRDYKVDITVNKDRSVDITETITVQALGQEIKRGILRDVPVRYRRNDGLIVDLDLEVNGVERDGQRERYSVTQEGRYTRIRIGDPNVLLEHGLHTYRIRYRVQDSIGFFDEYDEIYWNAIGDEWGFWINDATVSVTLPPEAVIGTQFAIYTGASGKRGSDYEIVSKTDNRLVVRSTKPFAPGQGMTVAVGWQKGVVPSPTKAERSEALLRDNIPTIILALGVLMLGGWLYTAWKRVGRDPDGGAIIPRYRPSRDLSPALASFIMGMGRFATGNQTSFMAALIDLAVKRRIVLDDTESKLVVRKEDAGPWGDAGIKDLPPGERALYQTLLGSKSAVTFADMKYKDMAPVMKAFHDAINTETDQVYFRRNLPQFLIGLVIAVIGAAAYVIASKTLAAPYIYPLFEFLGAAFCVVVITLLHAFWRSIRSRKLGVTVRGAFITVFFTIFFGIWFVALAEDGRSFELGVQFFRITPVLLLTIGILLLVYFSDWMKAPTILGRKMMDEIEGLKLFMTVTVAEQAKQAHAAGMPDLTPQLYEDLLPYAIALGVEQDWSDVFEKKIFSQLPPESSYRPSWYRGDSFNAARPAASLAGITSSLNSGLSSAMTPPASSTSGSGGGGSSGGGGGGGGGGGW